MKKYLFILMSVLLPLVLFSACSSDDEPPTSLYDQWVLVSYVNETGEVQKEAQGYNYLIIFRPDGTYSGRAYGNAMGGGYKCKGKEIQINHPDITQLYVEGSDPDQFFLEHLADVYTYAITDTELRLYYAKDQYFRFRNKGNRSDYCYTGIVKYIIPETESVQVIITDDPTIVTDRPVRGDMIVFASKDLTNSVLQVDDVVEFKIIEYEMVNSPGGPADAPRYYKCKVKPCK